MKPHSTYVVALHDNPGGDIRFVNNLFVDGSDASQYSITLLPVIFDGNVYTKGAVMINKDQRKKKMGEMNDRASAQMKQYKEQDALEKNAIVKDSFDASVVLLRQGNSLRKKQPIQK